MRVLIADDNEIVRMGLAALLARIPEVEAVVEARDGLDALELIDVEAPDIVLLDVRMPRLDGLGVLERLAGRIPALMLTHSEEPDIVRMALARGARGYLVHGAAAPEEIAGALRTCMNGGFVLSAAAATAMSRPPDEPQTAHPFASVLTEREFHVLEAAAAGQDNPHIAKTQFLSPRTVKNYLNAAYAKLDVHSRAEAVAAWHEASKGVPRGGSGGAPGGAWPWGGGQGRS